MPAVVLPPGAADNEHVPSSIYVIGVGYRQERVDLTNLTGFPQAGRRALAKQYIVAQTPCPAKPNCATSVGCRPIGKGRDADRDNFLMSEKY